MEGHRTIAPDWGHSNHFGRIGAGSGCSPGLLGPEYIDPDLPDVRDFDLDLPDGVSFDFAW